MLLILFIQAQHIWQRDNGANKHCVGSRAQWNSWFDSFSSSFLLFLFLFSSFFLFFFLISYFLFLISYFLFLIFHFVPWKKGRTKKGTRYEKRRTEWQFKQSEELGGKVDCVSTRPDWSMNGCEKGFFFFFAMLLMFDYNAYIGYVQMNENYPYRS